MNSVTALQLLFMWLDRAQAIGALISKAQESGRDITDEELDALVADDDAARKVLAEEITKARIG